MPADIKEFLALFVDILAEILFFAILFRIIISWIRPMGTKGTIFSFVFEITEPILSPFRRIIPRIGMIDISPIVALLVIELVRGIILSLLL